MSTKNGNAADILHAFAPLGARYARVG